MKTSLTRVMLVCLLPLALILESPHCAEAKENGTPRAGQCQTLVYSTNPNYPPYDWSVDGVRFDGASIELLEMAAPPGVELKPAVYPWKRSLFLAEQGKIDLLVSLRITPERASYLVFTKHRAFPNPIVVFVRQDRTFPFESWADLKSKRGGISLGDTFGAGFDEYWRKELHIEEASTMEDNFNKLDTGRIDYFVTSKYVGEAYSASHSSSHGVASLSPPISVQDIHFGFSRRSPCAALVEQMSLKLEELDREGIPERLLQKHLRRIQDRAIELPEWRDKELRQVRANNDT